MIKFLMPYISHIALFIAIVAEVIGTSFVKDTEHFTKLTPSLIVMISFAIAFYGLSIAVKTIPLGVAYAIWAGLGVVLVTVIAVYKYKEIPDMITIAGIGLIVFGVVIVNLRITTPH